ncbi:MAG TPA: sulfatase [Vicinamibacteria bacterium]|nr:sulfatase [Vicinamibacteria bacterium]
MPKPRRTSTLVAMLATAACGTPAPPAARPPGKGGERPARIVFVLLDTVRADRLAPYGYAKDTMPFLSQLASKGVVFEKTWAPSSWTPSSMASIFTGLWVNQHGVLIGYRATRKALKEGESIQLNRIPRTAETLPEVMKKAGYRTYGVADNINIGKPMGFTRGFDRFTVRSQGAVKDRVAKWKGELRRRGSYFLYLHYMEGHGPFRDPARDGKTQLEVNTEAYEAALRLLDGELRSHFETLGLLEPGSFIVIAADHGEEFWDHGGTGHDNQLYEELLRVPLILYAPGLLEPARVKAPVTTVDILPTLREVARAAPSPADQGVSLLKTLRGEATRTRTFYPMRWWDPSDVRKVKKAVVRERYKFILNLPEGTEELYDLETDPEEKRNLETERREIASELKQALRRFEHEAATHPREFAENVRVSPAQAEELKALGYVQ